MLAAAARLTLPRPRRDSLGRMGGLSALLHLGLVALILALAHRPPSLTQDAGPISIEVLPDIGLENGETLPVPSYSPGIVRSAEAPASEPPPPPSTPAPAVPLAALPPPAPAPSPSTEAEAAPATPPLPVEAPDAVQAPPLPPAASVEPGPPIPPPPPPAVQAAPGAEASLSLPPPAPPLPPAPPEPRTPVATAQPLRPPVPRAAARPASRPAPRAPASPQVMIPFASGPLTFSSPSPPQRPTERTANSHGALDLSLGPEALNSKGAPPHTSSGLSADIRVIGAEVGNDWIEQLHDWWDRHAYYPRQAVENDEEGEVEIHMVILRDGQVESINVVRSSGSRWLDMAGQGVFRNAHLMPFPLSTPEPRADVYLYLHYILLRG